MNRILFYPKVVLGPYCDMITVCTCNYIFLCLAGPEGPKGNMVCVIFTFSY